MVEICRRRLPSCRSCQWQGTCHRVNTRRWRGQRVAPQGGALLSAGLQCGTHYRKQEQGANAPCQRCEGQQRPRGCLDRVGGHLLFAPLNLRVDIQVVIIVTARRMVHRTAAASRGLVRKGKAPGAHPLLQNRHPGADCEPPELQRPSAFRRPRRSADLTVQTLEGRTSSRTR